MKTQDFHGIAGARPQRGRCAPAARPKRSARPMPHPRRNPDGAQRRRRRHQPSVRGGSEDFDFAAPIMFHGKTIGQVHLGIPEQPLSKVARLSLLLMALLVTTTVAAVALASYFMANRFAQPARLLETSLGRIARGELDYRIAEQRKDEFGQLYQAFDKMAQALEQGHSKTAAGPPSRRSPPRPSRRLQWPLHDVRTPWAP
ncbi:MAG: HAMP domain-containing protein [Desulfobacterales bacterium]|nr:HAMP domain-containing protein [Desulfobacterales bacterium]